MGVDHDQTDAGIEYQVFLDEISSELVDQPSMAKGFLSKKKEMEERLLELHECRKKSEREKLLVKTKGLTFFCFPNYHSQLKQS